MSKLRYILVFLIVLLVTIFTFRLLTSVKEPARDDGAALLHHPDYFINNFQANLYDKDGKANYKLRASQLEHFPDDDSMELQNLDLEYTDKSQQKWLASSKFGTAFKDIEVLNMREDVKVVHETQRPENALTLYTNTLVLDSVKRTAATDDEVKIVGKNSTIFATGMLVELDAGKITLKSKARAEYAPN
jgi:lipopolysaccharide export system protein LptC